MAIAFGGCSTAFDPYNQLEGFRLLAMRSEPPDLAPGSKAALDALLFQPVGGPILYKWSWCPFSSGADQGYRCALSHDQFQAVLDQQLGAGAVQVPSFDLGTTATVAYAYDLSPSLYKQICRALQTQSLPRFVEVRDCTSSFPIDIGLSLTAGKEHIDAVKTIHLDYDAETQRNANPSIDGASIALNQAGAPMQAIDPGQPPVLKRNTEYKLVLAIPDSASETYVAPADTAGGSPKQVRESLVITWFVEAGKTDKTRTIFIDGSVSLAEASRNLWTTPKAVDFSAPRVRLYFVIRDGRGGIGWLAREVLLEGSP